MQVIASGLQDRLDVLQAQLNAVVTHAQAEGFELEIYADVDGGGYRPSLVRRIYATHPTATALEPVK